MSRKGNCWDNAPMESFFGTFKRELDEGFVWPTRADAIAAVTEYMRFYNVQRLHSTLDYVTPEEYDRLSAA